jgi:hypothetical protein
MISFKEMDRDRPVKYLLDDVAAGIAINPARLQLKKTGNVLNNESNFCDKGIFGRECMLVCLVEDS